MSDPFIGEIRMFAGTFAPYGWALCNGQVMPIQQNTALFSLLGATYGGDGMRTFALPDLQGRSPIGSGDGPGLSSMPLGSEVGAETVTLSMPELPAHTHAAVGTAAIGTTGNPSAARWAQSRRGRAVEAMYGTSGSTPMASSAVGGTGGGQPHDNLAPYQTVTFIIALQGIFPARS